MADGESSGPAAPRSGGQREETEAYVQKHELNQLFAHLLQLLLYHRPDDPRAFLCAEVRKIREEKVSTALFTEQDLETMFDMIDVTKQRWITVEQLRNTCANLATAAASSSSSSGDAKGESGPRTAAREEAIVAAADAEGHVTLEKFKAVLGDQLVTKNVWS